MENTLPVVVFVLIIGLGLLITWILLKVVRQMQGYSNKVHAFTLASGLAVTSYYAFNALVEVANPLDGGASTSGIGFLIALAV